MSFILRTVDEHLINYHTHLGDTYNVVNRERSPEYFEQLLKRDPFGGDPTKAFIHVGYWGGYKYIQEGEHAYIMTSTGETFENITPPKRIQTKEVKQELTFEQSDPILKNWSKLTKGAGKRISLTKNDELRIVGETEFGRSITSFNEMLKGLESKHKCLVIPRYDGSLLIKGYTARLHENEINQYFSKFITCDRDVDSNGPYYVLKAKGLYSEKFPVFDELVMSLVGYGLLFDMEAIHTIVTKK